MRTCIDCRRWRVEVGVEDWSEETPGNSFSMSCGPLYEDGVYIKSKGHWELNPYKDGDDELRKYLKMAETCKDFLQR